METKQLDWNATLLAVGRPGCAGLAKPDSGFRLAKKEPAYPQRLMADLVLHIHRELIHHLSEVCLLRDLYLHTKAAPNGVAQ